MVQWKRCFTYIISSDKTIILDYGAKLIRQILTEGSEQLSSNCPTHRREKLSGHLTPSWSGRSWLLIKMKFICLRVLWFDNMAWTSDQLLMRSAWWVEGLCERYPMMRWKARVSSQTHCCFSFRPTNQDLRTPYAEGGALRGSKHYPELSPCKDLQLSTVLH